MSLEVFDASGTFTWPADTTHVVVEAWGAGGKGAGSANAGGGGGGGQYVMSVVWKTGATTLPVTIGSGSSTTSTGRDTIVTQGGVEVAKAKGGGLGTEPNGGSGSVAGSIHTAVLTYGGNGGNAGSVGGGGGGSSAGRYNTGGVTTGVDGTNAALPGFPGDGSGGDAPTGGGDGGDGGDLGENGAAGDTPGGGGGGGGDGASGGNGGNGKCVISWGLKLGHTRFSAACCCSICDLSEGDFPNAVTLNYELDADASPSEYPGAGTYGPLTLPGFTTTGDPCENAPDSFPDYTTGPHDTNVIDNGMVAILNAGSGLRLEITDFEAGIGTPAGLGLTSDSLDGISGLSLGDSVHYCKAVFQCPIIGEEVSDVLGSDRWCEIGSHPGGNSTSQTETTCQPTVPAPEACYTYSKMWFVNRSSIYAASTVTVIIMRKYPTDSWYYAVSASAVFLAPVERGYNDNAGTTTDGGAGDTLGFLATQYPRCGGPYTDGREALDDAKTADITLLEADSELVGGNWGDGAHNAPISIDQYGDCACCDAGGGFNIGSAGTLVVAWNIVQTHYFGADTATVQVSW